MQSGAVQCNNTHQIRMNRGYACNIDKEGLTLCGLKCQRNALTPSLASRPCLSALLEGIESSPTYLRLFPLFLFTFASRDSTRRRNLNPPSSNLESATMPWLWDSIESYRLNPEVVDNYLKEKFGNWNFSTKVLLSADFRNRLI